MQDTSNQQPQQATGANGDQGDNGEQTSDANKPVDTVPFEQYRKLKDQKTNIDAIARDYEKKYKEVVDKYGHVDLEEYNQMRAKMEEAERKAAANDPAKWEEMSERKNAKLRQDYETRIAEYEKRVSEHQSKIKEYEVTDKVMSEITSMFNEDVLDIVKGIVSRQGDKDEEYGLIFRDENGEIMFHGNRPLTPKEFGAKLVERRPSLAKATGVTGGANATTGTKTRIGKVPETFAELRQRPDWQRVWDQMTHEERRKLTKGVGFGTV